MSRSSAAPPLGVKLVAVWAVITGAAVLVLGITQTPWYLPVGVALLAGAYGLWTLRGWGLLLVGIAFAIDGARNIREGAFLELAIVLALLAYLYTQRRRFAGPELSLARE